MRILLDTHVLIWSLIEPARLSGSIQQAIRDSANDVLFSAASIWEIAIKKALGRVGFSIPPDEVLQTALDTGLTELPVEARTAIRVAELPLLHRDPFDRLLVAQAIAQPAVLFTADRQLVPYSELVRHIGTR